MFAHLINVFVTVLKMETKTSRQMIKLNRILNYTEKLYWIFTKYCRFFYSKKHLEKWKCLLLQTINFEGLWNN